MRSPVPLSDAIAAVSASLAVVLLWCTIYACFARLLDLPALCQSPNMPDHASLSNQPHLPAACNLSARCTEVRAGYWLRTPYSLTCKLFKPQIHLRHCFFVPSSMHSPSTTKYSCKTAAGTSSCVLPGGMTYPASLKTSRAGCRAGWASCPTLHFEKPCPGSSLQPQHWNLTPPKSPPQRAGRVGPPGYYLYCLQRQYMRQGGQQHKQCRKTCRLGAPKKVCPQHSAVLCHAGPS